MSRSKHRKTKPKARVRPLKKVKVEIAGSLVRHFEKRLDDVERTVGRGRTANAIGFTMSPYWEDE